MKVKVVFGKDIRLWHGPKEDRFATLVSFVETTFELKRNEYLIQYEDTETDRITMSGEEDFEEAMGCALSQDRKSLKLFVTKRNQEQEISNDKEEKEKDSKATQNEDQKSENDKNCCKPALDFLLDENVKRLIPELVRDVMRAMRRNNDGEVTLADLVESVISEEKYTPIVCHEFYQTIKPQMPIWLAKVASCSGMLLMMNEEHMLSLVSTALNALTMSLTAQNADQATEQIWNPMKLFWGNSCQQRDEESVVHHGITCDGCNVSPIVGARFKCTLCSNFDLCSDCESLKNHDPTHTFIKMRCPRNGRPWGGRCFPGAQERCGNQQNSWHGQSFGCMQMGRGEGNCGRRLKAKWLKEDDESTFCLVNSIVQKKWKVVNIGSEEWGDDVTLAFMKGNDSLALEKKYTVPNAKPEETVNILAAIQVPQTRGHYNACFRLQKDGKFFGPQLWVRVLAVEESNDPDNVSEHEIENDEIKNDNENESIKENEQKEKEKEKEEEINDNKKAIENQKKNEEMVCTCICGEPMVETTPMVAYYKNAEVSCDLCGEDCSIAESFFHCFSETDSHSGGYDVCLSCAQNRMHRIEQTQKEKKEVVNEPKVEEPASPSDIWKGFEYANEGRAIEGMGFADIDLIKEVLLKTKGDVPLAMGKLL